MSPAAPCARRIGHWLPLVGLLSLTFIQQTMGQEWTRFRGPNGSGLSTATTVPVRWTDKDYRWKVPLPGVGHSSPVLWGERLFLTSGEEATGKQNVLCLHAKDGSRLWTRTFAAERHGKHIDNSFASGTPAVDERHLYVCWGNPKEFIVQALDHEGQDMWRVDLGPYKGGHGFGTSLIVHEDQVIVNNDQDGQSALVALDRATGKTRWKVARQSKTSYATPCVFQAKDRPAELIFTSWEHGITSIDPKTGQKNWEADIFSKGHVETPIGSPIVAGDLVFGTCGWMGVKKEVVAVRPGERGAGAKRDAIYRIDRAAPLVTTPLVKDDLFFLWSDEGLVSCANVQTGEVYWRERVHGAYYGSPVCVGNHLYCISRDGEVLVLPAGRKFEMPSRYALGEGSHSTPAVAGGTMYLRTFSHLIALGGK